MTGPESGLKADKLAAKMREALANMNVHIARKTKTVDLNVMDLDESVTPTDAANADIEVGGYLVNDLKLGEIRRSLLRLGSVWVRCSLVVVRKLAVTISMRFVLFVSCPVLYFSWVI